MFLTIIGSWFFKTLDAHPNILLMLAHDDTMLDVVDKFPNGTANEWMKKGWKEKGLWRFLKDFGEAAEEKLEGWAAGEGRVIVA